MGSISSDNDLLPSVHPTQSFWQIPRADISNERTGPNLPKDASIVIVGSGITAAFAAWELAERGHRDIVVLEARETCSGATGRNGGHLQPLFYEQPPPIAEFELRNFQYVSEFIKTHQIPCEFEQTRGGCHAFYSGHYFAEAKAETLAVRESHPHLGELVEIVEDKERLRELRVSKAEGALVQKLAAKLSPYRLVCWIWEDLVRRGVVKLQTRTPVFEVERVDGDEGWQLKTNRGVICAKSVLLATNAYTGHFVPEMKGLIVPVQGEMSALKLPEEEMPRLDYTYCFIGVMGQDRMQDDYLVQRPMGEDGGQLMFGGGRCCARKAGVDVPSDERIDEQAANYLRSTLPMLLDYGFGEETVRQPMPEDMGTFLSSKRKQYQAAGEWTGIMGFSRDGSPWVGGVPGKEGLFLCGGYTGHGMPNASLCGQHVARLIDASTKSPGAWQRTEEEAVRAGDFPREFVLTEQRLKDALQMPELTPETKAPNEQSI